MMIKKNQMNGQFQMLISNPVYGTTPPGIDEVSQEQVFKQMREMNAQNAISRREMPWTISDHGRFQAGTKKGRAPMSALPTESSTDI